MAGLGLKEGAEDFKKKNQKREREKEILLLCLSLNFQFHLKYRLKYYYVTLFSCIPPAVCLHPSVSSCLRFKFVFLFCIHTARCWSMAGAPISYISAQKYSVFAQDGCFGEVKKYCLSRNPSQSLPY